MLHTLNTDILETSVDKNRNRDGNFATQEEYVNILLVEDIYHDALLTTIAIEATNIPFSLCKIKRGDEVLSKLRLSKRICPSETPDVIILDLGLPGMDGFEVLSEMAHMSSSIRSIPIVLLTAHQNFEYIQKTYPLYIMAYLNKPCKTESINKILLEILALKKSGFSLH